mmetsp:Transcript_30837/g.22922  ORF Transcript_30837/g.22922 Transcript_30837/m.22922 type:complete len:111 (-) Transcript_30837:1056-1388(-)|eukprot:CAMPEP_0202963096 /NCGR_PEP_ID=MMETSP1396-20130829/7090_1 /ASSEMBLY_ACC=CAM_ASM_000872 /TAXON_ID= /ORGANISM="Pseudokeronopsis sp., Strain Brazil" /LENGTH=110 /DNA_ID=CAMNT_0049684039 /DNA_START=1963 /DNA_END=2295 /DNA_ORIENTATION=+
MLSVPIPSNKEQRLTIRYFPANLNQKPKEFVMSVSDYGTLNEIRPKIMEQLGEGLTPFFVRVRNKTILELVGKDKLLKQIAEKGDEICAIERVLPAPGYDENFLLEVKIC